MLQKMKYVVPLSSALVLFFVMSLVMTPILSASPNEVPFAIVSLDKGSDGTDSANLGETLANALVNHEEFEDGSNQADDSSNSASTSSDMLAWTRLDTEEEAEQAVADNEYYGAVIIPADFTSSLTYDKMGMGNAPSVKIVIDQEKNPAIAATMQSTLKGLMTKYGIDADIQMANKADVGDGTLAPTLTVPLLTITSTIMSLMGALLVGMLQWPRKNPTTRAERLTAAGKQVVYLAVLSAVIAGLALTIQAGFADLTLPKRHLFSYIWLCSFCLLLCGVGLIDLMRPLGSLVAAVTFGAGLPTAVLGPEMLPAFCVDYIYPWAPQHYLGEGMRTIIYSGTAPAFGDIWPLLVAAAIGIVALAIACALPKSKDKSGSSDAKKTQKASREGHAEKQPAFSPQPAGSFAMTANSTQTARE